MPMYFLHVLLTFSFTLQLFQDKILPAILAASVDVIRDCVDRNKILETLDHDGLTDDDKLKAMNAYKQTAMAKQSSLPTATSAKKPVSHI